MKNTINVSEYIKPDFIDLDIFYGFSQSCTSGTINSDEDDDEKDCNILTQICNTGGSKSSLKSPCTAGCTAGAGADDEQDEDDEENDDSEQNGNLE